MAREREEEMRYLYTVIFIVAAVITGCATGIVSTHTLESPYLVRVDLATNIMPLVHVASGSTKMKKGQKIVLIDLPVTIEDDATWIILLTQVLDSKKRLFTAELRPILKGKKLGVARVHATEPTTVHWTIARPAVTWKSLPPKDPKGHRTF